MDRQRHNVLSHAGIYLVARGAPGIITFASIPLFTRLLNAADFGQYALVVVTAMLGNALLFQWLRLALVRYLPAHRENPAPLKSTVTTICLSIVAAAGAVALILALLPIHGQWKTYIGTSWLLLSTQSLFEMCCEYSRAAIRPWRYMALQVTRAVANVGLGALLIVGGFGWRGPVLGVAIGMAIAIAVIWRTDWRGVRLGIDTALLKRLAHYGVPVAVTFALTIVISSSDRFLIAWKMGEDSAGLYSVAVDFTTQTLSLLMMVIQLAMFPLAVRAFEDHGREAAQEQMKLNASLMLGIGVPAVIGMAVLAPGLADCVLGATYRTAAASIIPLIAVGTFLASFKAFHFDAAFQFAHRTIHQVWIVLFAAAINIPLNLLAIPRFGINGAAMASVLAYLVSIVLTIIMGRRHFHLPFPIVACAKVLAAGCAMGLLLLPLRKFHSYPAVGIQVLGGAALYGSILLATDVLGSRGIVLKKLTARRSTGIGDHGRSAAKGDFVSSAAAPALVDAN